MGIRKYKRVCLVSIPLLFAFAFAVPIAVASDTNDQPGVRFHFSFLIKAGKTQEALKAFKELGAYFTDRFKTGSGQIYILKSNERDHLHYFIDYKDKTSFKKTQSAYRADAEWRAKLYQYLGLYLESSFQYVVYSSITAFATDNPVADLSQGQEGNIFFSSINLGSFREILAGEGESKPVTISGSLKIPEGISGKVPAVIILHESGGVNDYYFEVADMLNKIGIAAFVVDSLHSRGIGSMQELLEELFHSYAIRISDAYAALELLSTHPKIDRNKIAVLGYSHGGKVALFVASEKIRRSFIADDLRFAASIAYYPYCGTQFKDIDFTDAPVLMLLAEKDNICPIDSCLEYAQRMKESGADVKVVVYKGAHHQFPVLPSNEIIKIPQLPDWSHCGKAELLFLRENGTWFFPHTNKTVDGVNGIIGDYTANCRIDGGAIVGGNEKAKIESIKEYQNLLRRVFNIN
jgi:dienelactone hydrolase